MFVVERYGRLLVERPLITKCLTSFVTFGAGDLLCQKFEKLYAGRTKYDWWRAARQGSFGFCVSPYFHLQFSVIMPYLFPATKKINIIKSVIYDQTVGACIFTMMFFTYVDLASGKSFQQMKEELKVKFLPTIYANWTVWPPLMLINFAFVPVPWRVLYANFFGMLWNAYLSYVQNVKSKQLMAQEKQ
jgi:protein Mpv17